MKVELQGLGQVEFWGPELVRAHHRHQAPGNAFIRAAPSARSSPPHHSKQRSRQQLSAVIVCPVSSSRSDIVHDVERRGQQPLWDKLRAT